MGCSPEERKAIEALFPDNPEEALSRIERGHLPPNLTRFVLTAYDRLAFSAINSKNDKAKKITIYGREVGVQEFRRELIAKALNICPK